MALRASRALVEATFKQFRDCGSGRNECQALWVGPIADPELVSQLVHPLHDASPVGFQLNGEWLTTFWLRLARERLCVRVQVHTHPGAAYHSATDDAFPIVHSPGFLSLVIPRFATGPVGLDGAYLTRIGRDGQWSQVAILDHLEIL
jgi:hypothetical protein